jgi:hypothetical protein
MKMSWIFWERKRGSDRTEIGAKMQNLSTVEKESNNFARPVLTPASEQTNKSYSDAEGTGV